MRDNMTLEDFKALAAENGGKVNHGQMAAFFGQEPDQYDRLAIERAKEISDCDGNDGTLSFDDHPITSRDEDEEGAYVSCWVWVDATDEMVEAQ